MTYISDPLENIEKQCEHMAEKYEEGVCMNCGKKVTYALVPMYNSPSAPAVCYLCVTIKR